MWCKYNCRKYIFWTYWISCLSLQTYRRYAPCIWVHLYFLDVLCRYGYFREREREGEWEREFTDTCTFLLFPGFWIWKVCSAFFLVKITCIYMYVESLFGQDFQFKMSLPIKNLIKLNLIMSKWVFWEVGGGDVERRVDV